MDGRVASTSTPATWPSPTGTKPRLQPTVTDYSISEIAQRPKLLRLRFTIDNPSADPRAALTQTFCFSFALPGLAVDQ
jgi:hypothetical protein